MSITIVTDVFCDGDDGGGQGTCPSWIHGTTGGRPDTRRARRVAREAGWRRTADGRDLCQDCAAAADTPRRDQ